MALLKFKRSAVPAKVPSIADLSLGELAINTYDGKVYTKKDDGTQAIVEVGGGGGVQTISSSDGSVTITGTTDINLSVPVTAATNTVLLPVRNNTGSVLAKGTAVYINGALGQNPTVTKAIATSDATSAQTLGLVTANINNNAVGNVTLIGSLNNLDTSAYSDGQQLYLSSTTAGALTATKPYAPSHLVYMAVVEHAHPTQGKLFVKVQNGYEMDELHDVSAQSPANNDGLFYNTSTSLWEKKSIVTALGYTPANKAGDAFTGDISVPITKSFNCYTVNYGMGTPDSSGLQIYAAAGDTMRFGHRTGGVFTERFIMGSGGNVTANVDFRAPIFYDNNNTAYYMDLTSSTSINAGGSILASGNLVLNNGANRYVRIGSATNYSYDLQTTGDDFQIIEAGTTPRLTIKYPSGSVLINRTSYSGYGKLNVEGGADFTGGNVIMCRDSGNVSIGTASASAVLDVKSQINVTSPSNISMNAVRASNFGYSTGYSALILGSTSGNNTPCLNVDPIANPSGSFSGLGDEVMFRNGVYFISPNSANTAYNQYLRLIDGYVQFTNSARAPIFYDSQNTAYYVDPASTSVLNTTFIGTHGKFYDDGNFHIDGVSSPVWINSLSNEAVYLNWQTSGVTYIGNSTRSPIYYDSNNTGYYFDGAGTTSANIVNIIGGLGVSDSNNDPYGKVAVTRSTGNNYTYYGLTRSGQMVYGMGIDTANQFWIGGSTAGADGIRSGSPYLSLGTAGDVTALGSFRAPVFYDSDNTAFYINPNTTSNVSEMVAYSYRGNGNVGGTGSASWHPSGIYSAGYNWLYGGISAGGGDITSVNVVYANAFYDGGNTNYYCDPSSTSVLNIVTLAGYIQTYSGGVKWDESGTRSWSMYPSGGAMLLNSGDGNGSFNLGASGGVRAPIFYDSNNTGYYVDPANASRTRFFEVAAGHYDTEIRLTALADEMGSGQQSAMSWWVSEPNVTWNNGGFGYNVTNDGGANGFGRLNTTFGQAYTRYTTDGEMIFYCTNTSGTRYQMLRITANNTITVDAADIRAPIYYDSANTGYYLDASSTGTSINVAGSIVAAGNVTAYSDIRIKANVETIPDALGKLDQIRGVTYTRTDLDDKQQRYAGVIAQEIEAVLPEAVRDLGNIKAVDYNATIGLLIQAVKELRDEVEALRK